MFQVRWLPLLVACLACHSGARTTAPTVAPAAHVSDKHSSDREAVLAVIRSYYNAQSGGDHASYASHFWPGATRTAATTVPCTTHLVVLPRMSPDSVRMYNLAHSDTTELVWEQLLAADVRIEGNVAQVLAHFGAGPGAPDSSDMTRGITAFTLLAHAGQWRIVALTYMLEE